MVDSMFPGKGNLVRILHVDDDSSIQDITKAVLTDIGNYEIKNASSVDEAFQQLKDGFFDVVVCDYEMPQKDGLELLKLIKEQKIEIPFILFTGKGREEVAIKALNLGADGYINKQGNPETVYGELSHEIEKLHNQNQIKKELALREDQFRQFFLNVPSAVAIYEAVDSGEDFIFKDFNLAAQRIEKLSKASVLGKRVTEVFPSVKAFGIFEVFQRVWKTGKTEYFPIALYHDKRESGAWRENWVMKLPNGNIAAMYNDITERKLKEVELDASEAKLRSIVENSTDQIFIVDKNHQYLMVNSALAIVLGKCAEEIVGKTIRDVYLQSGDQFAKNIDSVFSSGKSLLIEEKMVAKGQKLYISSSLNPVMNEIGEVIAVAGIVRDITERNRSEDLLKSTLDATPFPVALVDTEDDKIFYWSRSALELFGHTAPTAPEWYMIAYPDPKYRRNVIKRWKLSLEEAKRTNKTVNTGEFKVTCKGGSVKICELYAKYLSDRLIVTFNDITERKKTENEVKQSEEKFRSLFEGMAQGAFWQTAGGNLKDVNQSALDIFGITKNEFLDRTSESPQWRVIVEDGSNLPSFMHPSMMALRTGKPVNNFVAGVYNPIKKDYVWVSINAIPKFKEGEKKPEAVFVTIHDITDLKKTRDSLRVSKEKYHELINAMSESVWVIDFEGNFLDVNNSAAKTLGYTQEELLSFGIRGIDSNLTQEQVKGLISRLPNVGTQLFETIHTAKDGKQIPVEISSSIVQYQGKQAILSIARDITERKKTEASLVVLNEKLRVVGGLTRHDVANKMMVAKTNLYMLEKRIGDNPDLRKYLKMLGSAIDESNRILEFSRLYEKIGSQRLGEIDVGVCFDEATKMFPNLSMLEIINECRGFNVVADSLLTQLLFNFIDNSLKHGEKVTKIKLHFKKSKDYTELFYEDDGVGVSEVNKAKLFSEGFTTGKGSGLGLKLIKRIVAVYGWGITEEGRAGEGAKFVITISSPD